MLFIGKHYQSVILYRSVGNLLSETANSRLSFAWWVLEPIFSMAVYYIVFSIFLNAGTEDFVPFLLIGLVFFEWFSLVTISSCVSVRSNAGIISQLKMPLVVWPSVTALSGSFKFLIVLALLVIFLLFYGFDPSFAWAWILPIIGLCFVFILGVAYWCSFICVFLPELEKIVHLFVRAMLFLSPIFYSIDILPAFAQKLIVVNPLAFCVSSSRDVFMQNQSPDPLLFLLVFVISALLFMTGLFVFQKYNTSLVRVIVEQS